jgi:hypothetical protein
MLQAVEQRIDQGLLLEQLVPLGQIEIGRNDGGDALIALVHKAEEGVGLFRLERKIPDLIDDHWLMSAQVFEQPHGGAVGERGIEFVEQCLGIVEAAAVAVEAGFAQEPEGNSGLSSAGRPEALPDSFQTDTFLIKTTSKWPLYNSSTSVSISRQEGLHFHRQKLVFLPARSAASLRIAQRLSSSTRLSTIVNSLHVRLVQET